jgi:hypothetical protein
MVERSGESQRPGPGLLWIDAASAVITRSAVGLKRALGPGIHFIGASERIGGTFSLHTQEYSIGPSPDAAVFQPLREDASESERREHAAVQAKRMAASARTRDGNEVVPEIRVVFRLNARPAAPGTAGSRFGFMKEAVEAAARAEGISPANGGKVPQPVAWNQLPGLIAVDLWREFLGKFMLDELFRPVFPPLPDVLQPEEPVTAGAQAQVPVEATPSPAVRLLRRLNTSLENGLSAGGIVPPNDPQGLFAERPATIPRHKGLQPQTALQIIGQMMRARMMQAAVPILDDCGRIVKGHTVSEEYKWLRERGLLVLDVSVEGLRFDPAIEKQIVQNWNTDWLKNASDDRRRIEQLELLAAQSGRQRALLEHADALGQAIRSQPPQSVGVAVSTLLRSAQSEIMMDERLYGRGANEVEALSQLLRWAEGGTLD